MPLPAAKALSKDELGMLSLPQDACAFDCTLWRPVRQLLEHGFVVRKSDIWHPEMVSV
jgi:hypothetical protein